MEHIEIWVDGWGWGGGERSSGSMILYSSVLLQLESGI